MGLKSHWLYAGIKVAQMREERRQRGSPVFPGTGWLLQATGQA